MSDIPGRSPDTAEEPERAFFGRRKGKRLRGQQERRRAELLPALRIVLPEHDAPLDPRTLFPALPSPPDAVWLEIGFGGGEHLAEQAARRPDVLLLGAEPFLNGAASLLRHVDERGLRNVRVHVADARELVGALPDASLDRVFVLFPDPWPKARHHKRRLMQPPFAAELARVLRPGGRLRFATDWADYADHALWVLTRTPGLRWTAEQADDWRLPPADHVTTRYEQKRLGDIAPVWLEFERT